ncbi:FecR protein [Dysgonomonas alginatilytica]|uniref:FecR protein n=1 Tax=Dysgonomonas alginatilytica TaxID=1605892 RepID=A0A2V3PL38_9BACT|nr:FecR family protein [Dysgonomonas alginatilytica]PXV59434.1 FecR protein [Dysgonomonas alginatilytica]
MKKEQTDILRNSPGYKIIYNLLKEYMDYPHSVELEAQIQNWLINDEHHEVKNLALNDLLLEIEFTKKNVSELNGKQKENLELLKRNLNFESNKEDYLELLIQEQGTKRTKRIRLRNYLFRAAAVLLPIIAFAGWYLSIQNNLDSVTLAQTEQIEQVGSLEISTPKGQFKEQELSDGSHVVLNAGSKLTYSNNKQAGSRKVTLVGEAYFSVSKVEEKTFVVQTEYLNVKVLGTKFDVKAYPEENKTVVTLNEGKIEVETINKEIFNIEPGQQLVYDKNTGEVKIKSVAAAESSAWKDGHLYFEDATINEIIRELERTDGVSFVFETPLPDKEHYSLKFTGNESLNQKMSVLKDLIGGFSYTIENNKVIIVQDK